MRGENKNEAMVLLMESLENRAFDFFCKAFSEDEQLTEGSSDYEKVKHALVDKFGRRNRPENKVRRALVA